MNEPNTKQCTKCGTTKSIDQFKLQKRKTGHFPTSWCRACLNEASKLSMREHIQKPGVRERMNEKDKARYHRLKDTPEFAAKERARAQAYNARPEVKARSVERSREWARANPKQAQENRRRWVQENLDKARAYCRKYYQTDVGRERHRLQQIKRRAQLHGLLHDLSGEQWDRIVYVWGGACAYCLAKGKAPELNGVTIDHVVPISAGGPHTLCNVVPACHECNSRKNNFPLSTFLSADQLTLFSATHAQLLALFDETSPGSKIVFPARVAKPFRTRGNGFSKLNHEKAADIRLRYAEGTISQQALADEYGVSQVVVSRVVRGKGWTPI